MKGVKDPTSIRVVEIRHYKKKDGLQHEFLLVRVKYGDKHYLLRIERSTQAHAQRSFWQKLTHTSTSIFPAFDTVSISSSFKKLTEGMNRGPIIHVATLPISSGVITLHELCLLLSLFPSFSPIYKLKEEQCYWFCNVVLATISSVGNMTLIPKEGFKRAGKFGRFAIHISLEARQLFIDGYKLVRRLQYESSDVLEHVRLSADTARALVAMLSVQSVEAKTQALISITSLASHSPEYRQLLLDAQSTSQLRCIFISSSIDLKAIVFLALDALGLPNFDPLPVTKSIDTRNSVIEDTFSEEDRKTIDSQYTKCLLELINLLADARPAVYSGSARVIGRFAWHENKADLTAIRNIVEVAPHSNIHVSLQQIMTRVFPALLHCPRRDIRATSIASLRKLADRAQLRQQSITIFPLVAFLFLDNSDYMVSKVEELYSEGSISSAEASISRELSNFKHSDVYLVGLKAISTAVKHPICHPIITDTFSQIFGLLGNKSRKVRDKTVDLLSGLIPISEFRPHFEKVIPIGLGLIRADNTDVRHSIVEFMKKVASDSNFHSIIVGFFPQVVDLLTNESWEVRHAAVYLLSNLIPHAKFRPRVEEVIPQVLELLKDSHRNVQGAACRFTKGAAIYFDTHPAIANAIPQLVCLLRDTRWYSNVSSNAADLLCNLMVYPHLRPQVQNIIPDVKELLDSQYPHVKRSAKTVLEWYELTIDIA